jgi:hypothetical protein
LLVAQAHSAEGGIVGTDRVIALPETVPVRLAVAAHVPPLTRGCEIVIVPVTLDATVNVNWPVAPPSAVQVPVAVSVCVNVAWTLSVTVTPDVTNCHVPDQSPVIVIGVGAGAGLELPHAAAIATRHPSASRRLIV